MSQTRVWHWAIIVAAVAVAGCERKLPWPAEPVAAQAPAEVTAAAPAPSAPAMRVELPDFTGLVEAYGGAVVNVAVVQQSAMLLREDAGRLDEDPLYDFFRRFGIPRPDREGPRAPVRGMGSGFIVSAEGYILTNAHVVSNASEVTVKLTDRREFPARVIGADARSDVAVLKIDAQKLPVVKLGDATRLKAGEWVVAIGAPFGFENSVTAGIVSGTARSLPDGYVPFIQTDVAVNPGNSGGPLFNLQGEVIGINTAIFSPSGGSVGIGFAIPSALAKPVIDQLAKYGRTRRGWLGVRIQAVTDDIAESFSMKGTKGALISSITPTGPAEKAGLKPGDIVLKFNGREIREMRELPRLVAEAAIDSEATIEYWRDGQVKTTRIMVGELEKAEDNGLLSDKTGEKAKPDTPGGSTMIESVGMSVAPISAQDRQAFNIGDDVQGVIVKNAKAGSEAAEKGLTEGDVIVEINQQTVGDVAGARGIIEKAAKAGRNSVLLLVNREGDVRFVALRLKK